MKGESPRPDDPARPPHPGEAERMYERRRKVFELRCIGMSYPQIATALGCGVTTAWEDVQAELHECIRQNGTNIDTIRQMEIERCHAVMVAMWPKVRAGGEKAATAYLKAMERLARLQGLDTPVKIAPTNPGGDRPYSGPIDLAKLSDDTLERILAETGTE